MPEHRIDRIVNNAAFVAKRWDSPPSIETRRKKRRGTLAPGQLAALQRLADGEMLTEIGGDDRRNLHKTMRAAQARLGAATPAQAVAIAVKLGLITVRQEYAIGEKLRISGQACRTDRDPLPVALRPVLVGICNGLTDQEIAKEKGCSIHTVKTQVQDLFARYGTKRRGSLVAAAIRLGHVY